VGSVLLGTAEFIKRARKVRKVFGGGMRQAGYLAAAGIYALEHNIDRLTIDHTHAREIAETLLKKSFTGKMMPVETNIIIFEVIEPYSAKSLSEELLRFDIRVMPISATQIRMVLHLDVTCQMVKETIRVIESL
jgi:threonine aldolase